MKGQPEHIQWNLECSKAFKWLEEVLIDAPIWKVANPLHAFILLTNASDQGVGGVLNQSEEDGCEHPVAYTSRKLLPRETKYAVIEKECLAVVRALKHFHPFFYGQN